MAIRPKRYNDQRGNFGKIRKFDAVDTDISRHVRVCTIDRSAFTVFPSNVSRNCSVLASEMESVLRTALIEPPYVRIRKEEGMRAEEGSARGRGSGRDVSIYDVKVLVGHELGGLIVQDYTYQRPKDVVGLGRSWKVGKMRRGGGAGRRARLTVIIVLVNTYHEDQNEKLKYTFMSPLGIPVFSSHPSPPLSLFYGLHLSSSFYLRESHIELLRWL